MEEDSRGLTAVKRSWKPTKLPASTVNSLISITHLSMTWKYFGDEHNTNHSNINFFDCLSSCPSTKVVPALNKCSQSYCEINDNHTVVFTGNHNPKHVFCVNIFHCVINEELINNQVAGA